MNVKRFLLAALAVLVLNFVLDFILHGLILGGTYKSMPNLWRPDMMSIMWIFYIGYIVFALIFTYIFYKGYEKKGIIEGVRYGLLMGILINGVGSYGQYVMYPLPLSLATEWFVLGTIEFIIYGIAVSLIYKD
jgi:hypothetical protein